MDRDKIELLDAFDSLGVNQIVNIETKDDINILLGGIHQESLTLAVAVYNCLELMMERVNIVMFDATNEGYFIFNGKGFDLCESPDIYTYSYFKNQCKSYLDGDSTGFFEYSENKFLTGIILRCAGINVPKELVFKKSHNKKGINISTLKNLDDLFLESDYVVLKPSTGGCGEGISMFTKQDINSDFYDTYIRDKDTLLLQEKIESYPISIDSIKKDWNLRVLVSFDLKSRGYKVIGMIGRIDNDGGPVNISLTADYINFDEITKLTGWTDGEQQSLMQSITDISVNAVDTLVNRVGNSPEGFELLLDHQDLAGVDIIIDRNLTPYVIEINPSTSCGLYKLMKNEGLEAIDPVVESIVTKVLIFNDMKKASEIKDNKKDS